MWRADRRLGDEVNLADTVPVHPQSNSTSPVSVSTGDGRVPSVNVAEPVWETWREQIAALGGPSPLLHFVDSPRVRIELSTTHPGGLAQFITGKTTLLSSLIRDDLAFRSASVAASNITAKGVELSATRGVDSIQLGIGIAEWKHEKKEYRAPILLRPMALRRYGRDFELRLKGAPYLNPALARTLREQFGVTLDANEFVSLATSGGSFKPQAVIDRLRALTSQLAWFNVQPRLVASSFAEVSPKMLADAKKLEHPVLDALAGNPTARWSIGEAFVAADPIHQDQRPPASDTLLLDADSEQENVVAQIAAGNSVVVKTLPGTGGTQTIVNALGCLVAQHKRVLVVSPRGSSLRAVSTRLAEIGLQGIAISPRTVRRDVIQAISRNEKATQTNIAEVDDALVRLRSVLLDYRGALARRDPVLGVSALDALAELARLSLMENPPQTTSRLTPRAIEALARDRDAAAETLIRAASLGEFRYGPGDSPWYGADFATSVAAQNAHQTARHLNESELPRLLERANELVGKTRLRPFESIQELGIYLRLLLDIRETLDRFQPVVFDRSLGELIAATGSRRDAEAMTGGNRRRLKKLAREYVRPGVHVPDLHESLVRIQQQRMLYQRFVTAGVTPEIPVGIGDVQVAYQRVAADLESLDEPLGLTATGQSLLTIPIGMLIAKLKSLAADSEVLKNLQERTSLMGNLRNLDLDPLLEDLSRRHVSEDRVGIELELTWWSSVLERMLGEDRALLGGNTRVLDRLEADFRLVDEAHAAGAAPALAWALAEAWKLGIVDWPDEATALKNLLRSEHADAGSLYASAPHLSRLVAPVWLASPYDVHAISDEIPFDAVFLLDAGAVSVAESLGGIRRARQTVVFGDPVAETPDNFSIAVEDLTAPHVNEYVDSVELDARHADSALARLGEMLPTLELTRSYRAGGQDLAELVNRRFYGGKISSTPWAGTFLGRGSLVLEFIEDGHGMPDPETGAVESVDVEVARVVELVIEHALTRPRESLLVVTASQKHAVRVQAAVLRAVAKRMEVTDFFLREQAEPFLVTTLEQAVALSRDRVIFSVGYGRTPHGRMLSNFGALGKPGGERLLASAVTRARRSLVVLSCFRPGDISADRMSHGVLALGELLEDAEERIAEHPSDIEHADAMLVDLSRRLDALGLTTALNYRGTLGLVASYEGRAIAIETDATVAELSLRESLRLRPEMLKRLGWHYLRVHSFELFADPESVALKIAVALGARHLEPHTQAIPVIDGD
ncbi:ATP-binding protein [Naasia lichenicola]|uniref:AAA family ATPase n=1 Tax=Naasia lichenicola TaxID=2565933 RepID=A0A4S4FJ69_9MICO|nr:ATP-binding protein [Naasia lichenicola]THG30138.1 AAA family ATPase [Naasia lichenicola]